MGRRSLQLFILLQCGDRLWSSESDVYRRQILTTKVDPRALRINRFKNITISHHQFPLIVQIFQIFLLFQNNFMHLQLGMSDCPPVLSYKAKMHYYFTSKRMLPLVEQYRWVQDTLCRIRNLDNGKGTGPDSATSHATQGKVGVKVIAALLRGTSTLAA